MELEVFVSGALCLACSGKCLLSSFIGGRSGNRGNCAQPCRHLWREIGQHTSESHEHDALHDEREGFFLSLKDQWQGPEEIAKLCAMGIDSVKIEGRMKSPSYVYEAVLHYRRLIDSIAEGHAKHPGIKLDVKGAEPAAGNFGIERIFNRGYAKGYFYDHDPDLINNRFSSNYGVEIGTVNLGAIVLSAPVRNGDGIVYLDANLKKISGHNVSWIDQLDDGYRNTLKKIDSALPGRRVRFEHFPPQNAIYVYKTFDYLLNRELTNELELAKRYEPIHASLTALVGQRAKLTLRHARAEVECHTDELLQSAQKRPTSAEDLRTSLDRFGETPFYIERCEVNSDPDVFVPKSILNSLRQEASTQLEQKVIESYRRTLPNKVQESITILNETQSEKKRTEHRFFATADDRISTFCALVRTDAQYEACRKFGVPNIRFALRAVDFYESNDAEQSGQGLHMAGSLRNAIRYESRKIPFCADWTFNVGNARSVRSLTDSFEHLIALFLSPELSEETLCEIADTVERPDIRLGLPVYGYLEAMLTRTTLFDTSIVRLVNHEEHPIIVVRNRDWYRDGQLLTGSTIYNGIPLDIVNSAGRILKEGIELLRFEFTFETAAEVLAVLKRAAYPDEENRQYHSYGFGRGIF